ncbi:hypothetical protein [Rubripirellula reticaptiva]|uniref:Uncharacterized protein n=1 Tax=Rubripirellula reticaptiva TaxID=2528013 RepID=A0A5C6FBW7_9BACT|nr:hypothetical protein [Rubripirellula reticaptiva]TWU58282.1 hypothetical protein Poly59_11930 [Rubripirellula reticaptiva]
MNTQPIIRRRPPQISLGFMMLMMVVFAVMSAGLLYAARVPAVQDELSVLMTGKSPAAGHGVSRMPHIVFIMFTFTSPLLLAGVLSTAMGVMRWLDRRKSKPTVTTTRTVMLDNVTED